MTIDEKQEFAELEDRVTELEAENSKLKGDAERVEMVIREKDFLQAQVNAIGQLLGVSTFSSQLATIAQKMAQEKMTISNTAAITAELKRTWHIIRSLTNDKTLPPSQSSRDPYASDPSQIF